MRHNSLEENERLAKTLLGTPEECMPWEPIPVRFSESWQVSVFHLDEDYGEDLQPGENLTIALAAYTQPTDGTPGEVGAWRIDFTGCSAYRRRITGYTGASHLTRSTPHSAFWEITGSHYLIESGVWSAYGLHREPGAIHHFVIVSALHVVYEVIARGWRCTPLPEEWAMTNYAPMPPWPPAKV